MITPEREGYGYGIGRMTRGGHDWVTHAGAMFGFSATLTHVLDRDVDIIVLSNSEAFEAQRVATGILKIVLADPP